LLPQDRACRRLCAERCSLALIVLPCGSFRLAGHFVSGRDGIGAWQNCKVRFKIGSWIYWIEDDASTGATVAGRSHSLTSTFLGGVYSLFISCAVLARILTFLLRPEVLTALLHRRRHFLALWVPLTAACSFWPANPRKWLQRGRFSQAVSNDVSVVFENQGVELLLGIACGVDAFCMHALMTSRSELKICDWSLSWGSPAMRTFFRDSF